jgi:ADP-ribose pyrophosphatase YjhB (NUDIX family)
LSENRILRIGAAALIVNQKSGAILMGKRNKDPMRNKWVLPGGGIQPFETWLLAAHREVLEETGILFQIFDERPMQVIEIINEPDEHRIILLAHGFPIGGELKAGDDMSEVAWVESSGVKTLDLSDATRQFFQNEGWTL